MTTFTNGQILTAAELNALAAAALSGTVTSVALSMPGDFAVAGGPVTNAGTLAVTRTTQGANLIQAGPASGAAAVPGYRELVVADLPPVGDSMTFQAGRFYSPNGISARIATSSFAIGSLVAGTPVFVPNAITLQTLSCGTGGTISGTAHARMALYTDAGGLPGAPVAGGDSGDLTQTTAGVLTSAALAAALAPGWYWPVWESSGLAGGTIWAVNIGGAALNAQMGSSTASGQISANNRVLLLAHTYGAALPNPWSGATDSITDLMPVIALGF